MPRPETLQAPTVVDYEHSNNPDRIDGQFYEENKHRIVTAYGYTGTIEEIKEIGKALCPKGAEVVEDPQNLDRLAAKSIVESGEEIPSKDKDLLEQKPDKDTNTKANSDKPLIPKETENKITEKNDQSLRRTAPKPIPRAIVSENRDTVPRQIDYTHLLTAKVIADEILSRSVFERNDNDSQVDALDPVKEQAVGFERPIAAKLTPNSEHYVPIEQSEVTVQLSEMPITTAKRPPSIDVDADLNNTVNITNDESVANNKINLLDGSIDVPNANEVQKTDSPYEISVIQGVAAESVVDLGEHHNSKLPFLEFAHDDNLETEVYTALKRDTTIIVDSDIALESVATNDLSDLEIEPQDSEKIQSIITTEFIVQDVVESLSLKPEQVEKTEVFVATMPTPVQEQLAAFIMDPEVPAEQVEAVEILTVQIAQIADRLHVLVMETTDMPIEDRDKEIVAIEQVLRVQYTQLLEALGMPVDEEIIEAFIALVRSEKYDYQAIQQSMANDYDPMNERLGLRNFLSDRKRDARSGMQMFDSLAKLMVKQSAQIKVS